MHDPVIDIIMNDFSIGYLKVLEAIVKMKQSQEKILVNELQHRFKHNLTPVLTDLVDIGLIKIQLLNHYFY